MELGGDAFGYYWLDADHFVMYLLDVCGHGVKAALLSISAMNVLRNQTLPATDFTRPAQVLAGLNDAFQMERHNGLYFTLFYAVYNKKTRQLAYANGGHPPAILMAGDTPETAAPIELGKRGMIVGGLPRMTFPEGVVDLPASSRLYIFSDGIYEITKPDGSMMRLPDFVKILADSRSSESSTIEATIRAVRAIRGGDHFEDDVSIVEVVF